MVTFLGILYTMLVEKVFKQNVPYYCKRKLAHLQESDINSIVKYSHGQEKHVQNDGRLYSTLGRYGLDVVVAMSWTMYHNAILSLHRWEKDGKLGDFRSDLLGFSIIVNMSFHQKCEFTTVRVTAY